MVVGGERGEGENDVVFVDGGQGESWRFYEGLWESLADGFWLMGLRNVSSYIFAIWLSTLSYSSAAPHLSRTSSCPTSLTLAMTPFGSPRVNFSPKTGTFTRTPTTTT